jgi:4-amino-4-deoxy-L-arabinose transferase-like glycosyltransferase
MSCENTPGAAARTKAEHPAVYYAAVAGLPGASPVVRLEKAAQVFAVVRERATGVAAIAGILLVAAAVRCWSLLAGVPHAVGIDEPAVIDRALRIMRTGDWNTHAFDYPTLVIYLHTGVAIVRYLIGAASGEWSSLDTVKIAEIYAAARLVGALIGVATVWLVYRLGLEIGTRRVGLLAAAQLAVHPMHVRESHFALTDVPVAALTTLTVLLSTRAARLHRVSAYGWAGVAAGLAAAAKYNGVVAFFVVAVVWLVNEWGAHDRWIKAGAMLVGVAGAFAIAVPYAFLDLPHFLDGLAAQLARFARASPGGDPAWLLYVKHLSLSAHYWVPAAAAGAGLVAVRSRDRRRWLPVVLFAVAYFYVLASHALVFGRYALPIVPMFCLLTAAAAVEAVRLTRRVPALHPARVNRALFLIVSLLMIAPFSVDTVKWVRTVRFADTRTMAADWLKEGVPGGARLAVENSGPTYLTDAGFRVLATGRLLDHSVDWYVERVDYLVVSAFDISAYAPYLGAGALVFEIAPTPERWGPPIRIVKLH